MTGYNDIAPRMGLAYDVFGNGKTAIKVNLSKYWQSAANDGVYIGTNVASTFAQTATRAWVDNGDFTPGCNLDSPLAQDSRPSGGDFLRRSEQPELLQASGRRVVHEHRLADQSRAAERLGRAAV